MTLEQQITSLEISKRLKELGVKQESLFWWIEMENMKPILCSIESKKQLLAYSIKDSVSAFTVSELGEMLPKRLEGDHPLWYLTCHLNDNYCSVDYETFNGRIQKQFDCQDKNEANARGKMLIFLLENKLI